mmetsp:Transcript_17266/g.50327  ORF Transcript_17266/g.50327 Transcript_17266/m.50327 type:complete len:344 (-) Transcript_17266:1160-2191(-)
MVLHELGQRCQGPCVRIDADPEILAKELGLGHQEGFRLGCNGLLVAICLGPPCRWQLEGDEERVSERKGRLQGQPRHGTEAPNRKLVEEFPRQFCVVYKHELRFPLHQRQVSVGHTDKDMTAQQRRQRSVPRTLDLCDEGPHAVVGARRVDQGSGGAPGRRWLWRWRSRDALGNAAPTAEGLGEPADLRHEFFRRWRWDALALFVRGPSAGPRSRLRWPVRSTRGWPVWYQESIQAHRRRIAPHKLVVPPVDSFGLLCVCLDLDTVGLTQGSRTLVPRRLGCILAGARRRRGGGSRSWGSDPARVFRIREGLVIGAFHAPLALRVLGGHGRRQVFLRHVWFFC